MEKAIRNIVAMSLLERQFPNLAQFLEHSMLDHLSFVQTCGHVVKVNGGPGTFETTGKDQAV